MFTLENARDIVARQDNFPVLYQEACRWAEIDENVALSLIKEEFVENLDYIKVAIPTGKRGRPTISRKLSLVCFMCFSVLSNRPHISINIRKQLDKAMKEIEDVKAELKTSLDIMNSQPVDLKLPVMSTSSKASSSSANPKKFDYENKEEHVINTYNYELKALSNYFHLHTKQSAEKLKELTDKVTFLSNELANQNSFIIRVLSNKS